MSFPASCTLDGQCFAFPDVCKTPTPAGPVPIPYPNQGMVMTATKVSTKVMIMNMPAVIETSEIPTSQGDEAGTAGGVVSGTNMQKIVFEVGSVVVVVEGKGLCYLTCVCGHNGSNANMPGGNQIAPSQAVVLISQ